jgi:hypothetical protein
LVIIPENAGRVVFFSADEAKVRGLPVIRKDYS